MTGHLKFLVTCNFLLVAKVTTAAVSLSGPIELIYLTNVEPCDKLLPYLWPQTISKHHADAVLGFKP